MNSSIISLVVAFALLGMSDATKFSFKQPEQSESPQIFMAAQPSFIQYYPQQPYRQDNIEQQREQDLPAGVKGAPQPQPQRQLQPVPVYPPVVQPSTIAYVVLRPVPQYPYVNQQRPVYPSLAQRDSALFQRQPIKGEQATRLEQPIQQQTEGEQDAQQLQQQPEEAAQQGDLFGKGKFLKLKSSLDRFAASAKAKFTLGSTYQVTGEEMVTPPAEKQQLKEEIPDLEPENFRDADQQQQQQFEQTPEKPRLQVKGGQRSESTKRDSSRLNEQNLGAYQAPVKTEEAERQSPVKDGF